MILQTIKCPNCNAEINADINNKKQVFCTYCGTAIYIDEGKNEFTYTHRIERYIHKRYTDDAKIASVIKEDRENARKQRLKLISMFGSLALIILCFLGLVLLINTETKKENEAIQAGLISAGNSSDWIDKDYHAAVAHFESAGFNNIELVDLDDSNLKFWINEKVATISIEGKNNFNKQDYFSPDSTVYITYH